MEPSFPLAIRLPAPGSRELLRSVHGQLKAAILDGRLQPGLRLPASRVLAGTLGISRNTVIAAYDLLMSEGHVVAEHGAGTRVADALPRPGARPAASATQRERLLNPIWRELPAAADAPARPACRDDFRTGEPELALFPFDVWRRLSARALRRFAKGSPGYAEPQGLPPLREAIAQHVSFTRAVACTADEVVVTAGAQQAFDLLARVLVTPGRSVVALEDPGYPPLRTAFAAAGARLVGVPVDDEGLVVERLPADARIVCVTPSHQFPLGVAMSARRRAALLVFAAERQALVIEDDYDGEFRFGGRPLDALQTLDRAASVFYVGTFSKSLFPALRIGFVVAPPWALPALLAAKQAADWQVPTLAQDTLAAFIAEGHLARHVRKMRGVYGERREVLLAALARHGATTLHAVPTLAGLHLTARLAPSLSGKEIVARAAAADVGVESLARYSVRSRGPQGLVFGYGTVAADVIDDAVRRLVRVIRSAR